MLINKHATWMQTESNQEVTKMTYKHAAKYRKTVYLGKNYYLCDIQIAYKTI